MINMPTFNTGDQFFANQATSATQEEVNYVTNSSQTLKPLDNQQLSRGACNYVSQGDYYSTTGSVANTYIGVPPAPMLGISNSSSTYLDGQRFRINISATNTGPSTLSISSADTTFGAIPIKKGVAFSDLEGNELIAGMICEVVYVQPQAAFLLVHNGLINYIPSISGGFQFLANVTAVQPLIVSVIPGGGSYQNIPFDNLIQSIGNFYNPLTFEATIPHGGLYSASYSTSIIFQATAGAITANASQIITQLQVNGVNVASYNYSGQQSINVDPFFNNSSNVGSNILILNKGDIVRVQASIFANFSGNHQVYASIENSSFNMAFIQNL